MLVSAEARATENSLWAQTLSLLAGLGEWGQHEAREGRTGALFLLFPDIMVLGLRNASGKQGERQHPHHRAIVNIK